MKKDREKYQGEGRTKSTKGSRGGGKKKTHPFFLGKEKRGNAWVASQEAIV